MPENLADQIRGFADLDLGREEVRREFLRRAGNKRLTRDEGEVEHIALFIMAIDVQAKQVFIGHHKKSNRWIPNGGHVDKGELVEETLEREIWEEWGKRMKSADIGGPVLLAITDIEDPKLHAVCRRHYDIWYLVKVNKDEFEIPPEILHDEFYETHWMNLEEARSRVDATSVLEALDLVEKLFAAW